MKRPFLVFRVDSPTSIKGPPSTDWVYFYEDLNCVTVKKTFLGSGDIQLSSYGGSDLEQLFAREHTTGAVNDEFLDGVRPPRAHSVEDIEKEIVKWFDDQVDEGKAGYFDSGLGVIDGTFNLSLLARQLADRLPTWFVPPVIPDQEKELFKRCQNTLKINSYREGYHRFGYPSDDRDEVVYARYIVRSIMSHQDKKDLLEHMDTLRSEHPPVQVPPPAPVGQRPGPHDTGVLDMRPIKREKGVISSNMTRFSSREMSWWELSVVISKNFGDRIKHCWAEVQRRFSR